MLMGRWMRFRGGGGRLGRGGCARIRGTMLYLDGIAFVGVKCAERTAWKGIWTLATWKLWLDK